VVCQPLNQTCKVLIVIVCAGVYMWFNFSPQFKNEIVAEITTSVMYNTRQVLDSVKMISHPSCCCGERNGGSVAVTRSRKKKMSDEDSDGALSGDQRLVKKRCNKCNFSILIIL